MPRKVFTQSVQGVRELQNLACSINYETKKIEGSDMTKEEPGR